MGYPCYSTWFNMVAIRWCQNIRQSINWRDPGSFIVERVKGEIVMETKIGPLENIIGEEILGYKKIPVDHTNGVNSQIILEFKSGKKIFFGLMCYKEGSDVCRPIFGMGPVE